MEEKSFESWTKETPTTPFTGATENSGLGLFFEKVGDEVLAVVTILFTDKSLSDNVLGLRKNSSTMDEIRNGKYQLGTHIFVAYNESGKSTNGIAYQVMFTDFSKDENNPDVLIDVQSIVPVAVMKEWLRELCAQEVEHVVVSLTSVLSKSAFNNSSAYAVYGLSKETRDRYKETLKEIEALENTDVVYGEVNYQDKPMYLRSFVPKELEAALEKGFEHGTT